VEDSGEDENNEQKTSKEATEPVSIMLLKITFRLSMAKFCSTFSCVFPLCGSGVCVVYQNRPTPFPGWMS